MSEGASFANTIGNIIDEGRRIKQKREEKEKQAREKSQQLLSMTLVRVNDIISPVLDKLRMTLAAKGMDLFGSSNIDPTEEEIRNLLNGKRGTLNVIRILSWRDWELVDLTVIATLQLNPAVTIRIRVEEDGNRLESSPELTDQKLVEFLEEAICNLLEKRVRQQSIG